MVTFYIITSNEVIRSNHETDTLSTYISSEYILYKGGGDLLTCNTSYINITCLRVNIIISYIHGSFLEN